MDKAFWLQCWQKNHIAFHQLTFHPWLSSVIKGYLPKQNINTFVPLCGKSDDILWFAQQGRVIGNELSDIACRDFFSDRGIEYQTGSIQEHTVYQHENISIWQGDFFKLMPEQLGIIDVVYDRAALVALPQDMQHDYINHLKRFISKQTLLFVIAVEFDNSNWQGPPFSVSQQYINQMFVGYSVKKLAEKTLEDNKFAQRKMSVNDLKETLYLIKRN